MFSSTNSFFISGFLSPYQCYSKSLKTYDSRVRTDGQTGRRTDANRFYSPMLRIYVIAMGQIMNESERYSPPGRHAGGT